MGNTYEFSIYDKNVEDIFLKYVEYNKSTVNKLVNVAILLFLSMQVGLSKDERALLKGAVSKTKSWAYK